MTEIEVTVYYLVIKTDDGWKFAAGPFSTNMQAWNARTNFWASDSHQVMEATVKGLV